MTRARNKTCPLSQTTKKFPGTTILFTWFVQGTPGFFLLGQLVIKFICRPVSRNMRKSMFIKLQSKIESFWSCHCTVLSWLIKLFTLNGHVDPMLGQVIFGLDKKIVSLVQLSLGNHLKKLNFEPCGVNIVCQSRQISGQVLCLLHSRVLPFKNVFKRYKAVFFAIFNS